MKKNPLAPPKHLKPATKAWFSAVVAEFDLDEHHVRLLQLAAESWDRCMTARQALEEHGIVYTDRFGAPRLRPEHQVERDSRISFARLVRELGLDLEEPASTPRPVAIMRGPRRA